MKLKIFYRSSIVWNIALFVLMSLAFIYLQYISDISKSVFTKESLLLFVQQFGFFVSVAALTMISFFAYRRRLSEVLYVLMVLLTVAYTVMNLVESFSKFSLILLFIYMIVAYYFYQFYEIDISESYYNPGYHNDELFEPMLIKIPVDVYKGDEQVATGWLTNWSEEGCFALVDSKKLHRGKYNIRVKFSDNEFTEEGVIVSSTRSNQGYGVRFLYSKSKAENELGWKAFYNILKELGYTPELLK